MKRSKKIKLLTTLSSLGVLSAAVPLATVSCSTFGPYTEKDLVVDLSDIPGQVEPDSSAEKELTVTIGGQKVEIQTVDIQNEHSEYVKVTWNKAKQKVLVEGKTEGKSDITFAVTTTSGKKATVTTGIVCKVEGTSVDTLVIDATALPTAIALDSKGVTKTIKVTTSSKETVSAPFKSLNVSSNDEDIIKVSANANDGTITVEPGDSPVVGKTANIFIDVTKTVDGKDLYGATSIAVSIENQDIIKANYKTISDWVTAKTLIPGKQYQITDFVTTVANGSGETYENKAKSAGNAFDLILTATSTNKFNENAKAVRHSSESTDYFASANLDAWTINYSFTNDTDRFDWADTTNGKGVIYYMKDENGNEAGYDFKNIQFNQVGASAVFAYTFAGLKGTSEQIDTSLDANNFVFSNKIGIYKDSMGTQCLNNILIWGANSFNNTFDVNCHDVTMMVKSASSIGNYQNNTFGKNCHNLTFRNDAGLTGNKFGDNCYNINVGNWTDTTHSYNVQLSGNTFEDNCNNITLGGWTDTTKSAVYKTNTFGNNTSYLQVLSDQFDGNTLMATHGSSTNVLTFLEGTSIKDQLILNGKPCIPTDHYDVDSSKLSWEVNSQLTDVIVGGKAKAQNLSTIKNWSEVVSTNIAWKPGITTDAELNATAVDDGNGNTTIQIIPSEEGTFNLVIEAWVNEQMVATKTVPITVGSAIYEISGYRSVNLLKGEQSGNKTVNYSAATIDTNDAVTATWAVYYKDTTTKPNYANIDASSGVLTVDISQVYTKTAPENLTIVATGTNGITENVIATYDIRVVPSGLNTITYDEKGTTKSAVFEDNIDPNKFCLNDYSQVIHNYNDGSEISIKAENIMKLNVDSCDPTITKVGNGCLQIYYATEIKFGGFNSLKELGDSFLAFSNESQKEIDFAPLCNVEKIGVYFMEDTQVTTAKNLNLMKKVTEVGREFLAYTNITTADLSTWIHLKTVGSYFLDGSAFTEIWLPNRTPPTAGQYVMDDVPVNAVIHCGDYLQEYKTADNWSNKSDQYVK